METNLKTNRIESSVKSISPSQKEIEAELQAAEVQQELERIIDQYTQKVKIKGFRVGKAPRDMVKQMFSPEIQKSLIDTVIPKVLSETLENHNIHPASLPVINDFFYEEGKPLRFKATLEVWPEFELPDYKKISVKKKEIHVKEEEVEQSLEKLRQNSAEYVPVEGRGVVDGDYVVIELQGKDLKTKRLMPSEKAVVLAGHADNEKVLNERLLGLKPEVKTSFAIAYPLDHQNKKLAGKEIEYTVKVISIKEKQVPEINDEFAKNLGEYEHLSDLKEKIREELLKAKENAEKREMGEEILRQIAEQVPLELPKSVVEQETRAFLERLLSSAPLEGSDKEQADGIEAKARKQAMWILKRNLILRKISEREGLAVSEQEIEQEISDLAKDNNLPLSRVRESLNQERRRETFLNNLLLKKTVDFLIRQAIIIN